MLRWLVGIGMVGAGMSVTLLAPAYACSSLTSIEVFPDVGTPGTTVAVAVWGIVVPADIPRSDDGSLDEPILSVKWGGESGRSLGTVSADEAGVFRGNVVIPYDARFKPGGAVTNYQVSAVLPRPDGTNAVTSMVFEVVAPKVEAPNVVDTRPPVPTVPTSLATTSVPVPGPGSTEPVSSPGSMRQPALRAIPGPAGADRAAGAATAVGARQSPEAPGVQPGTLEPDLAPVAPLDLPAPNDIWSGLDSGQPSLLDRSFAPSRGSAPSGAILLGAGLVMLTGLGLVGARRRMAPARIVRR